MISTPPVFPPPPSDTPSNTSGDLLARLPPPLSRPISIATTVASSAIPVTASVTPSVMSPTVVCRSSLANMGTFTNTRYIDEAFRSATSFFRQPDDHDAALAYKAELHTCTDTGVMDVIDPRVYASKTPKDNADMPTFQQAMNGPEAAEYLNAMKLEIQTLKSQNTWVTVDRPKDKQVLKSTWAFKLKRLPDGTAYRHKARFCARGDMQTVGADFFRHMLQLCSGPLSDSYCPPFSLRNGRHVRLTVQMQLLKLN